MLFVHRRTPTADLYYIDNRSDQTQSIDASFRVTGKAAELWHADTGKVEAASYAIADGRTTVPLASNPTVRCLWYSGMLLRALLAIFPRCVRRRSHRWMEGGI